MKTIIAILLFSFIALLVTEKVATGINPCQKIPVITKDSTTYEIEGVLVSKAKTTVKLKMNSTELMPQPDQTGVLSKYFENKFGNMTMNGWLNIADIKVVSVNGLEMTVVIEKELSVTYINGEKKNHFVSGNRIKISWVVKE